MIRRFSIAAVLAVLVGLGAGRAYAQGSETLNASVPFSFTVGEKVLPAGRYELSYDAAATPGVLLVRSRDGRHSALTLVENGPRNDRSRRANEDATLVFGRQGSSYVLSQVFGPDRENGLEVVGTSPAD